MTEQATERGFTFPTTLEVSAMGAADAGLHEVVPEVLGAIGVSIVAGSLRSRASHAMRRARTIPPRINRRSGCARGAPAPLHPCRHAQKPASASRRRLRIERGRDLREGEGLSPRWADRGERRIAFPMLLLLQRLPHLHHG